ncbi:hypothetical protein [Nitrosospira briensis]|nr:hypothetical protein [Nitrosospira briensis]
MTDLAPWRYGVNKGARTSSLIAASSAILAGWLSSMSVAISDA